MTCLPQAPYLKGLLHAALLHRRRDAVDLNAVCDALAACLNTRTKHQVSSSGACSSADIRFPPMHGPTHQYLPFCLNTCKGRYT